MAFLTYQQVLEAAGAGRKHLLLGNGFSIGCDARFRYDSLYEYAKEQGLSPRAQAVFERLGTNNFEGVLRALDDAAFIGDAYGLNPANGPAPTIAEDIEHVKNVLVSAVAGRHLDMPSDVADERKAACVKFLREYHNVFTTNYDLLLYWVEMYGLDILKGRDGFRAPPSFLDAPFLEFHERVGDEKGIFFLHGALHLFVADGEVRKHSWTRTGTRLTTLIRDGLAVGEYPLFVAEGDAEKKRDQITRNGYLSYVLGKFERVQGPIVLYGLSLGNSDRHIGNTIADARSIKTVFVGIFEDEGSPEADSIMRACQAMQRRRDGNISARGREYRTPLEVLYFDSKTAAPWG